jgi:hypothetical protein
MRYFLLVVFSLFFVYSLGYGQGKASPFPRKSITRPDSLQTMKLVKTIMALDLKPTHEVDKIPAFIKEAFLCWNKNGRSLIRNRKHSLLRLTHLAFDSGTQRIQF